MPQTTGFNQLAEANLPLIGDEAVPIFQGKKYVQAPASAFGGGGRVVTNITTGASPLTLTEPFADVYVVTSGGTGAEEDIDLPAYGAYAGANVGKQIIFSWQTQTASTDNPTINYAAGPSDGTVAVALNQVAQNIQTLPLEFVLVCDGQYWIPLGWRLAQGLTGVPAVAMSGVLASAEGQGTNASGFAAKAWGEFSTASGALSTAWGSSSTASGDYSTAWNSGTASGFRSTAWGSSSTASGDYSTAWNSGTASGDHSTAWNFGYDRGVTSVTSIGIFQAPGLGQRVNNKYPLAGTTNDGATSVVLCTDNTGSPSAINQVALPNGANSALGAAYTITGRIDAVDPATGNMASWNFSASINQAATAASTVLLAAGPLGGAQTSGPVALTAVYMNAVWVTAASVVVTLQADVTNGAFQISVVGVAATTIDWLATVDTTEITF